MSNDNVLQQVQTYNEGGLATLVNSSPFLNNMNSKFKDFDNIEANKGDVVTFDKPPRFTTTDGLVASFQPLVQRVESLTVNRAENTSYEFSAQQFIFNIDDYMEKFGMAAMAELGTQVEADIATVCETSPFRFYGNGVDPISNSDQLATALALFRNFGSAKGTTKAFLDDLTPTRVVNSNLNQFAPLRNDSQAKSWELGNYFNCDWMSSNLLPIHEAGTEGKAATTLTVVSTVTDANGAVTAITFSGTDGANDANSIKLHDSFQFNDGVAGQTNLRYLTFTGHKPSQNPVQFRATANASSNGSNQVTVSIFPALQVTQGNDQNINTPIVAGMQCSVLPSHRCGLIMSGNPLYIAMPRLPGQDPFKSSTSTDPETGCSLRTTFGTLLGENRQGLIHDVIWGKTLVSEYAMKIVLPV